jgi:hypothetical protein
MKTMLCFYKNISDYNNILAKSRLLNPSFFAWNNVLVRVIVTVFLSSFTIHYSHSQTIFNPSSNTGYDSAKAASVGSVWGGVSFTTDSIDYQPGSTVTFTGSGFFANEFVRITVELLGNPAGVGSAYFPFDVQCDVNGGFNAYWYVDSQNLGRSLQATVIGLTSGYRSIALFTDGTPLTSCYFPPDGTYTTFPANDDGSLGPINLGFNFNLYGVTYTQCFINNNGNITFSAANGTYSSSGFPNNIPMIAPFWADVDTRGSGNNPVRYKVSAGKIIITWPGVGYYNQQRTLLNQFQVILTDGNDASIGLGNNVQFNYGDMQWTTGDASGGSAGFGGTPATVGISKGDNVNYVQVGRFGVNSSIYDGGLGNTDGVNYLDYECFSFNVSNASNIPPSVTGRPTNDTFTVTCGSTSSLALTFLPPEVNQTVSSTINIGSLCNTTTSTTSGTTSVATINVTGSSCNVGSVFPVVFTGTDNFNPTGITTFTIYVRVVQASTTAVSNSPICSGNTLNLSTTPVIGATYSWTGPNGFSSTLQNPTITNATTAATGTYILTATPAGGCAAATSNVLVTINAKPSVPAITGTTSVCVGQTSTLANATSGGTWSSSATNIATVNSSGLVLAIAAGTTTMKYLVVSVSGCRDSSLITITVNTNPPVPNINGTLLTRVGSTTTLSSSTSGGVWSSMNISNATVAASTGNVTGVSNGTAIINYTITNANNCSATNSATVTINPFASP